MGQIKKWAISSINFGQKGHPAREIYDILKKSNVDMSAYIRKLIIIDNSTNTLYKAAKQEQLISKYKIKSKEISKIAKEKEMIADKLLREFNYDVVNLI